MPNGLERELDFGGAVREDAAVLVGQAQPDLDERHRPDRLRVGAGDLGVEVGHVALEGGPAEARLGVPHHAVLAGPAGQVVGAPGAHGGAVAVGAGHADLARLAAVDVAARGSHVQAVALARVDPGALLVEGEALHPAGVLVDPGFLDAGRGDPAERAPDAEQEGAVRSGEAGDAVRADHPPRQRVARLHLAEARGDALAVGHDPVVPQLPDPGELGLRPLPDLAGLAFVEAAPPRLRAQVPDRGRALARHQGAVLVDVNRV